MWQLSESVDGMAEACNAMGIPVVGGNVSLYNESGGNDIDPTPVVGLLGVVDSLSSPPPGWNWKSGDSVVLVGKREAHDGPAFPLGGSRWATRRARRGGTVPSLDVTSFNATIKFVAGEIAWICKGEQSDVTAVHDVGSGGLSAALAEIVATTGVGLSADELTSHGELFSEFPGRFVMATSDVDQFVQRANSAGVDVAILGTVGGDSLRIGSTINVSVSEIESRRSNALSNAIASVD
jgi:phosphoribosylformylglycinamidine synthase